jgi:hypothetical protein
MDEVDSGVPSAFPTLQFLSTKLMVFVVVQMGDGAGYLLGFVAAAAGVPC